MLSSHARGALIFIKRRFETNLCIANKLMEFGGAYSEDREKLFDFDDFEIDNRLHVVDFDDLIEFIEYLDSSLKWIG